MYIPEMASRETFKAYLPRTCEGTRGKMGEGATRHMVAPVGIHVWTEADGTKLRSKLESGKVPYDEKRKSMEQSVPRSRCGAACQSLAMTWAP